MWGVRAFRFGWLTTCCGVLVVVVVVTGDPTADVAVVVGSDVVDVVVAALATPAASRSAPHTVRGATTARVFRP